MHMITVMLVGLTMRTFLAETAAKNRAAILRSKQIPAGITEKVKNCLQFQNKYAILKLSL